MALQAKTEGVCVCLCVCVAGEAAQEGKQLKSSPTPYTQRGSSKVVTHNR